MRYIDNDSVRLRAQAALVRTDVTTEATTVRGGTMKILLVYPLYPDTFWSFKHALRFIAKKALHPPLGLLTVAAMLPSGWEKRLIDMNTAKLKDSDLQWADYVFIGGMAVQRESAKALIARCRALSVTLALPEGRWVKVLDSSSGQWGGHGENAPESLDSSGFDLSIDLDPYGFALYHTMET